MTTTLLLRGRAIVTTEGCACDYDERLGIGWTCDPCLDAADTDAVAVDLADL